MGEKKILILRASGCARVSGADLSRRAFTICYDRVFPVSMRPAAGTRQITREQREIIIRWRVSCKSDRGESVAPASRRAFGHVRPRSRNTIAPFHAIQLPAQRKESTLFYVHSVRPDRPEDWSRIGSGIPREGRAAAASDEEYASPRGIAGRRRGRGARGRDISARCIRARLHRLRFNSVTWTQPRASHAN